MHFVVARLNIPDEQRKQSHCNIELPLNNLNAKCFAKEVFRKPRKYSNFVVLRYVLTISSKTKKVVKDRGEKEVSEIFLKIRMEWELDW